MSPETLTLAMSVALLILSVILLGRIRATAEGRRVAEARL